MSKTLSQTQVKVVTGEMFRRLHQHYSELNQKSEPITDKRISDLKKDFELYRTRIDKLNADLKKKHPKHSYVEVTFGSTYSTREFSTSYTNTRTLSFPDPTTNYGNKSLTFHDHTLAEKAEKAIEEVNRYVLALQLGTDSLDSMDALITRLTK